MDLDRDRDLVESAQSGDPTAFAELYTRYFNRLVRFAAKRVGDTHEAEEIAQETFARAYRALPEFGGERRFYPWVTVIAGRLCVDALRRRGRLEVGEVVDESFLDAGFERLDRQGDIDKVNVAMARLTDRHREILELRERQGWSYQHIADHLEVSLGTVEALLWRARKALRREFTSLGAAVLCLPGMRRWAARSNAQPAALAMVGSLGTAVARSLGTWGSTAATAPATVAPAISAAAGPAITYAAVMNVPAPIRLDPPATAVVAPVSAPVAGPPPAVAVPTADSIAIVPTFMSHDAANRQAQASPIHIVVPTGSAIGLNPDAALAHVVTYLGGPK
ncbi:MAG: hypothetical protein NVSMB12_11850 [Acidimicrobiales bacterium]